MTRLEVYQSDSALATVLDKYPDVFREEHSRVTKQRST